MISNIDELKSELIARHIAYEDEMYRFLPSLS